MRKVIKILSTCIQTQLSCRNSQTFWYQLLQDQLTKSLIWTTDQRDIFCTRALCLLDADPLSRVSLPSQTFPGQNQEHYDTVSCDGHASYHKDDTGRLRGARQVSNSFLLFFYQGTSRQYVRVKIGVLTPLPPGTDWYYFGPTPYSTFEVTPPPKKKN